MKIHVKACIVIAFSSFAYADNAILWDGLYKQYQGTYLMYSGDFDEMRAPVREQQKIAFMLQRQIAKDMFNAIGPDLKHACGASPDLRVRQRGDIDCTYDKSDEGSPYTCHFGINLRTGKSIAGASC